MTSRSTFTAASEVSLDFSIRKWYEYREFIHTTESGRAAPDAPLEKFAIAAAIKNPHAGSFGADLTTVIERSEALGREFGQRLVALARGMPIESYGKACIVGTAGEYEHGNAFLTTTFANPIREAIGGAKAWIASTGKRGSGGTTIDVPLAHKDSLYVRSHYDTITLSFGDAPAADEVVIIFVAATGGRLHSRLGGPKADDLSDS
jgi:Amino acid synthesis